MSKANLIPLPTADCTKTEQNSEQQTAVDNEAEWKGITRTHPRIDKLFLMFKGNPQMREPEYVRWIVAQLFGSRRITMDEKGKQRIFWEKFVPEDQRLGLRLDYTQGQEDLHLCLHGTFMIIPDAFEIIREMVKFLEPQFKSWHVSVINIRQDLIGISKPEELLPKPLAGQVEYMFFKTSRGKDVPSYYDPSTGKDSTMRVGTDDNYLRIYDKSKQLRDITNLRVRAYYEHLYGKQPVLRVENALGGKTRCRAATKYLLTSEDESSYCQKVLGNWALRCGIRVRGTTKSKQPKNWPYHPRFRELFFLDKGVPLKVIEAEIPEYLPAPIQVQNIEKAAKALIKAVIHSDLDLHAAYEAIALQTKQAIREATIEAMDMEEALQHMRRRSGHIQGKHTTWADQAKQLRLKLEQAFGLIKSNRNQGETDVEGSEEPPQAQEADAAEAALAANFGASVSTPK